MINFDYNRTKIDLLMIFVIVLNNGPGVAKCGVIIHSDNYIKEGKEQ